MSRYIEDKAYWTAVTIHEDLLFDNFTHIKPKHKTKGLTITTGQRGRNKGIKRLLNIFDIESYQRRAVLQLSDKDRS